MQAVRNVANNFCLYAHSTARAYVGYQMRTYHWMKLGSGMLGGGGGSFSPRARAPATWRCAAIACRRLSDYE